MFDFTSYQDNTASLYVASEKGQLEVVQRLLRAGVDVNEARGVSDVTLNDVMT